MLSTLSSLTAQRCILSTRPALCNQWRLRQLLGTAAPPPLSFFNQWKEFVWPLCLGSEELGLA